MYYKDIYQPFVVTSQCLSNIVGSRMWWSVTRLTTFRCSESLPYTAGRMRLAHREVQAAFNFHIGVCCWNFYAVALLWSVQFTNEKRAVATLKWLIINIQTGRVTGSYCFLKAAERWRGFFGLTWENLQSRSNDSFGADGKGYRFIWTSVDVY